MRKLELDVRKLMRYRIAPTLENNSRTGSKVGNSKLPTLKSVESLSASHLKGRTGQSKDI